jgi:hypothetical protein
MDLNHIDLPAVTLVDFYATSLVDPGGSVKRKSILSEDLPLKEKEGKQEKNQASWITLGHNKKNIQIILLNKETLHLPDEELQFLTGILTACKLSIADVAILNLNNYPAITCKDVTTHFNSKIIFLFGVPPIAFGLPMDFPEFQPQTFDKTVFLFSPALKDLEADKILKSKLWVCLRRIFDL